MIDANIFYFYFFTEWNQWEALKNLRFSIMCKFYLSTRNINCQLLQKETHLENLPCGRVPDS